MINNKIIYHNSYNFINRINKFIFNNPDIGDIIVLKGNRFDSYYKITKIQKIKTLAGNYITEYTIINLSNDSSEKYINACFKSQISKIYSAYKIRFKESKYEIIDYEDV